MPTAEGSLLTTKPPCGGLPVILYDGHCRLCTSQAHRLARLTRGKIALQSFQEKEVLANFPGLSYEDCMREIKLVDPAGRVFGGAEAIAAALYLTRPMLGKLALCYYIPLLRWAADRTYVWMATNRYRLFGRTDAQCNDLACSLHFRPEEQVISPPLVENGREK